MYRFRLFDQFSDILSIIDLSTFDPKDDMVAGKAPEYITKDKVCNFDRDLYGTLVSPPHSTVSTMYSIAESTVSAFQYARTFVTNSAVDISNSNPLLAQL